jgi:peptidoglycan-associated lipoprotein
MKSMALVICAALAVSACSRGADPNGLFDGSGAGAGGTAGLGAPLDMNGTVIGPDGQPIAVSSIQYFNQIIGDRVHFAVDQSTLSPQARNILDLQAQWLLAKPGLPITVEGHADEQGTRQYNLSLSARRASSVRDYLVTKGVPDGRLSTLPFGKERPLAICSDESCWAKNRRAVTVVSGGAGA